jgi:tRNA threonylcarbamoyladenosine biosynthesis protein TsaB
MLILALDTTTRAGSVALWRDGLLEARLGDEARTHAERLPGDLIAMLERYGATVADVDRYAVASGPGSFTGMRVGIATIQALALVHERLVTPISALEALAHEAASAPAVAPGSCVGGWMEAYRGDVFAALYRVDRLAPAGAADPRGAAALTLIDGPRVAAPDRLASAWADAVPDGPVFVAGDGAVRAGPELDRALGDRLCHVDPRPLAGTIAALAARRPADAVRPHAIVPLYVRRPDAELAREAARAPLVP